jgi:hypothetical protein
MWILDLGPYIYDVDNAKKDLEVTVENDDVVVNGLKLVFYSEKEGSRKITVSVSDGEKSASHVIQITYTETEKAIPLSKVFNWVILTLILIVLITLFVVHKKYRGNFMIDEVFIIYKNGILITHKTNKNSNLKGMENEILSSMFTAIQDFVKDAFQQNTVKERFPDKNIDQARVEEWQLKELQLEGHNILIEHFNHAFLAIIYSGTAGWKLKRLMKNTMDNIEKNYSDVLPDWKGKMDEFEGIDEHLKPLMK